MQGGCGQNGLAVAVKARYDGLIQHVLLADRQQPCLPHKAEHKVGVVRIHPAAADTPHALDACG